MASTYSPTSFKTRFNAPVFLMVERELLLIFDYRYIGGWGNLGTLFYKFTVLQQRFRDPNGNSSSFLAKVAKACRPEQLAEIQGKQALKNRKA